MSEATGVRLRNTVTGAVVQVREDKVLGSEWVPADEKPKRATAKK